jgi:hypothetical protein
MNKNKIKAQIKKKLTKRKLNKKIINPQAYNIKIKELMRLKFKKEATFTVIASLQNHY